MDHEQYETARRGGVGLNLWGADLWEANLGRADLRGADLREADLGRANLRGADLRGADLRGANLREANLREANLREAEYSITQVLAAQWGVLGDRLTSQLMRLDADALPDGYRLLGEWAAGGECPLERTPYGRVAHFRERRECWPPGPPWTLWQIWRALAAECGVKITGGE